MKKVLSLVLVIAMVLSSMSFAFASTFEDIADTDYAKAIETLTALGVVTGYEDGTYRPEKVVTRAEMAKLMVQVLGYGDLVAGSKSNFADTQGHWADAWIALAAGKGMVVGDGNGKFRPDATVSYDEVYTMLVRGLGYTDTCNELKGMTWPTNFKVKAAELGITKNVSMSTTGADRGGVAQTLFNALEATLVSVDTDGNVVKIVDTFDGDKSDRILLSRLADKKTIEVSPEMLDKTSKKYAGGNIDLTPYMYQELVTYVNYTDKDADRYEVVYVKKNNSVVLEGTVSDLLDENGDSVVDDAKAIVANKEAVIVVEDAKEKEHKVVVEAKDSLRAFYNGEEETIDVEDFEKLLYDNSAAKITVIVDDKNDNGKADNGESPLAAVVEKATVGVQVSVDYQGKLKVSGINGSITLPEEDDKVDMNNVTVTGAVDSLDDIKADDIVIAYESISGDVVKLAVSRNTVDGKVTKTNGDADVVYIDGTKYEVSEVKNSVGIKVIEAGDEGIFYLDDAGKIFVSDTDGAELTDYAVITDFVDGAVVTSANLNKSVDKYAKLTLLTASGSKVTYNILSSFDGSDLDDAATVGSGSDKLIDVNLEVINVVVGNLIKYSIDEDNYIDEVKVIPASQKETIDTDDIEEVTTEDTVAFYESVDGAKTKFEVVSLSSVSDGKATVAFYTSGTNKGKIAAILTTFAKSENDSKFGVIKSTNYITNAKGDKVVEVTALVDGEEVKFLTAKGKTTGGTLISANKLSKTTTATAIQFKLNASDVLTDLVTIVDDTTNTNIYTNIKEIDSQEVTLSDDTTKFYTSDCAVYTYDVSEKAWTIGDTSDIDDNATATTVYSFEGSSRISLVVQTVK